VGLCSREPQSSRRRVGRVFSPIKVPEQSLKFYAEFVTYEHHKTILLGRVDFSSAADKRNRAEFPFRFNYGRTENCKASVVGSSATNYSFITVFLLLVY